jgi:hypothetical protein
MSLAPFNWGWVMVMLSQLSGQAQIWRAFESGIGNQTNTLTVVWSPSPSPGVAGYALYWGVTSDACTNRLALGNVTNVTLGGFRAKVTYHFAVAAYDQAGDESLWSNAIQYSLPDASPSRPVPVVLNHLGLQAVNHNGTNSMVRLSFVGLAGTSYQLQATEDFKHWEVLLVTNCARRQRIEYDWPATGHCRFFRLTPQ